MRALGVYLSFISVLTVAYTLFLLHSGTPPVGLLLGALIGFSDLWVAYQLMHERRIGLALAVFMFGLTTGFSGYFLGAHYFSPSQAGLLPDIALLACSLTGFIIGIALSPTEQQQAEQYTYEDEHVEQ